MTDIEQPNGGNKPTGASFVREVRDGILPFDPSLESLVALVNLMDTAEVGVTLHVKGAVVSGMLISTRRFFKLLTVELEAGVKKNPHAARTAGTFADFYKPQLKELEKAREDYIQSEKLPPRPHHIHIRQALTYVSTGAEPITQSIWRGRLTEVDGWGMGNMGGRPPDLPEELW